MSRILVAAVAAGLAVSACGLGDGGDPKNTAGGASTGTAQVSTPPPSPGPEPTSCPNGGRLIEAVDIPAVHADPVHIPAATVGGQKIPAVTIPGVDIPADHIPAQCVERKPAPGGCLGAVSIPGTSIPGTAIPAARIPGVQGASINAEPVEEPAVTQAAVTQAAVAQAEVCQGKPSEEGQYVASVYRPSVYRPSLYRPSLYRPALYRPRTCNDKGECIPSISVPSVSVPPVSVRSVSVPSASLKSYVAGPGQVIKGGDKIAYNIEADVLFDFGKAGIKPDAADGLAEVARSIRKEVPSGAPVQVDGHTDSKGDPASNRTLSERRAQAIVDWLATKGGIDRSRLKATGYGETKPAAPNTRPDGSDDPEGRAKNRRVVISAAHS
ncbi:MULTISPECIES: OmpA family protein [unclassified Spirillospora]|uniref:OmpA family protein n=1 Tax=unclassified Spirillospora TaxID=2642701 RepID=UPI003722850D